jgi:hypothetical protein
MIFGRVRSSSFFVLSCEEFDFDVRATLERRGPGLAGGEKELRTVRFNDLAGDRFQLK